MKRLFFRGSAVAAAGAILFREKKGFEPSSLKKYRELEAVVQDDGRFSLWGNTAEDTDLLQDTRKDPRGLLPEAEPLADEVSEEE